MLRKKNPVHKLRKTLSRTFSSGHVETSAVVASPVRKEPVASLPVANGHGKMVRVRQAVARWPRQDGQHGCKTITFFSAKHLKSYY